MGRVGGHDEVLRGNRGEAVGEKLGADPVDRIAMNVGTRPGLPSAPAGQAGPGRVVVT
jgi:hypothetical protein